LVSDLRGVIEVLMESFKRNDLIQKVEEIQIVVNPVEEISISTAPVLHHVG